MRTRVGIALLGLVSWPLLGASIHHSDPDFDYRGARGRYVILINIDALNEHVFHKLYDAGRLPNLSRLIHEKGGQVGRLVSSFPSSSAPAIPEFFHGRFLDRSRTLPRKVHAFDRETLQAMRYTFKDRDWEDDQIDLWDICARGGIRTVTYYLRAYDGVGANHFRQKYLALDSLFEFLRMPGLMSFDKRSLKDAARLFARVGEPPQLAYLWCDTLDVGGHVTGPYSPEYERKLEEIDRGLGWLFEALRSRRLLGGDTLYERTSILVFGDHGLSPSHSKIRVGRFLKQEGLKLRDTSLVKQFLSEYLGTEWASRVDAIFVPGGSTVAELYLRRPARPTRAERRARPAWTQRLSRDELQCFATPRHPEGIDLVRALARLPGMDLIIVKEDETTVRLVTADRGEAVVALSRGMGRDAYAYVPIDGGDPLGYLGNVETAPLVTRPTDSEPRVASDDVWLMASLGTRYPYAVPRLPRSFGLHPTESDLIAVARPGFDFLAHSKGDHGGLDPETMLTPLVVAGPGANTVAPPLLRTVDLLPTVLQLMGIGASPDFLACLDGVPFGRPSDLGLLAALPASGQ